MPRRKGNDSMRCLIKRSHRILCLVLACVFAFVTVPGLAAVGRDEILRTIYQYCETELGYTREELTINNLEQYKDGSCAFSFYVNDPEPMTNALVRGSLKKDGTLDLIQGPAPVSVYEWLSQELAKAFFNYEDVYRLKQEWEPKLDSIPEEELERFNARHEHFPILDFLRHDIVLPDGQCISYETAAENSIRCIEAMNGWKPEMTKHIGIIAETVHIPDGMDHPVYQFIYTLASLATFEKNVVFNEEYTDEFDRMVNRMMDEEDRIFGKNQPIIISVRIDACTGEQIGEIYLETPPVTGYDYTAIMLWK